MALVGTVAAVALTLTAGGATAAISSKTGAPGTDYHHTELYFGGSHTDGSPITPADFEKFLDQEVTPVFPDGLTWYEAHGQWKGGKEGSYVLVILWPSSNRHATKDLEEIRTDYKVKFHQESVLRADSIDRVSF
jgi:hypothetical protein